MIFVTVGTHEQQFNRLIEEIDILKEKDIIQQDIFIQTGYSDYKPKNCQYSELISYEEMLSYTEKAEIVITHGGPGSIMLPLSLNKVPIVVPRQSTFKEHVDDHQVLFSQRLAKENKIIPIYNIKDLEESIVNYNEFCRMHIFTQSSNLDQFIGNLEGIVDNLLKKS